MPSLADHLPSGNQKRFWRGPVKCIGQRCDELNSLSRPEETASGNGKRE
jgi:hypothetical protein